MTDKTYVDDNTALSNRIDAAWLNDANIATYRAASAITGTSNRKAIHKAADVVSVKDFGTAGLNDVGTGNATIDTAAFLAALATGHNVYVPEGTYYISSTITVGYGQRLYGAGQYKTTIIYSGNTTAVLMGHRVTTLIYNVEVLDLTITCTSRQTTVLGLELQNVVQGLVRRVSLFGSASPNSAIPAEQTLVGSGLYMANNTILTHISGVSARLWKRGYYLETLAGSQSYWVAACLFDGQGELANNGKAIVVGNPATNLYCGTGCVFHSLSIQGNYEGGIDINAGDNTVVDGCYFEGNANYDLDIGTVAGAPAPLHCKVINNVMESEDIGTTVYGTFPYLAKITLQQGIQTKIRDNNLSISTAIPMLTIAAACTSTSVTSNRLNSGTAATWAARVTDSSATTIHRDNEPEQLKEITVLLSPVRVANAASGNVSYTGFGFRPTSLRAIATIDTTVQFCEGFATASGARCMISDTASAKTVSSNFLELYTSAGNGQTATVLSWDADGVTLAWTKVGAAAANDIKVTVFAQRD